MEIDPTYLVLSLIFSMLGMGLFLFGKKSQRIPHLAAGIAVMVCPYFLTNAIAMCSVCMVLAIAPFVMPQS